MNDADQSQLLAIQLLAALAERLRDDPQYMARTLDVYQRRARLSDAEMARALGATPEMLLRLALCRRPASDAPDFAEQARELADFTLIDETRLIAVIRQADSLTETSPRAERINSFAGALAPIRHWARAFASSPVRIIASAVCLIAVVIAGALVWQAKRETQAPNIARREPGPIVASPNPITPQPQVTRQPSRERIAQFHIRSADYPALRSVTGAGRGGRKSIELPASRIQLVIELPERSVKGLYRVGIADADGNTLKTWKAGSLDGKKLTTILDLRGLSGKASLLSVGRVGESPLICPVTISDSKAPSKQ